VLAGSEFVSFLSGTLNPIDSSIYYDYKYYPLTARNFLLAERSRKPRVGRNTWGRKGLVG